MAGDTTAGDADVVHRRAVKGGRAQVAGLAGQSGRQVSRRVFGHRRHALKGLAGMAARTAAHDTGVVHRRAGERGEVRGRVADLAPLGSRHVVRRLGHRLHVRLESLAVVAIGAAVDDAEVVHLRAGERGVVRGRVADLAPLRSRQVGRSLAHDRDAGVGRAGVAAGAAGGDAGVFHRGARERGEVCRRVAGLACARGREVARSHALDRDAGIAGAGVAAGAAVHDAGVFHRGARERGEVRRRVTGLAGARGLKVATIAYRYHALETLTGSVAVRTAIDDAGVFHCRAGERGEVRRRVAGLARQRGRHMDRGRRTFGHRFDVQLKSLAVVAVRAPTGDAAVVHRGAGECGEVAGRVAALAVQRG